MSNIKAWGEFSVADAQVALDEAEKARGGSEFYKPTKGKNTVRILPPLAGQKMPFVACYQHLVKAPNGSGWVVLVCPRLTSKQGHCPMCKLYAELSGSKHKADQDLARTYQAKLKAYWLIVDREDPEAGAKVMPVGPMLHKELLNLLADEDKGGPALVDPANGYDVIIKKSGEGMDTEYKASAALRPSPLGDEAYEQFILENIPDTGRYIAVPETEEIVGKMLEAGMEATAPPPVKVHIERAALPANAGTRAAPPPPATKRGSPPPPPPRRRAAQVDAVDGVEEE